MILRWLTDPHLDHYPGSPEEFGKKIAKLRTNKKEVLIITGDIATATSLKKLLNLFIKGYDNTVLFVCGNHDAYYRSIDRMRSTAEEIGRTNLKAIWLTKSPIIWLSETASLVGHDGWYDARNGSPFHTQFMLWDFEHIEELRGKTRRELVGTLRRLADSFVAEAEPGLREAATKSKKVYFATHVPPFPGAAWHQGKPSDDEALPWFSSKAMGDMLVRVASDHENVEFTVLCGHSHSDGTYQALPNLEVLTGRATYGSPEVWKTFEI